MSHQNRDKEEALELKVPLCPENCKISASTTQICSGSTASDAKPDPARVDSPHLLTTVKTDIPGTASAPPETVDRKKVRETAGTPSVDIDADVSSSSSKKSVNRCSCCGKRVGLTGFRCRCGDMFCSVHRYSDRHDCIFDYKAAGREAIARENPLVRAAKISRI